MGTVRESAIKAIALLVPRGSREAIDWISPRLDDWHESVRRAAVVAVAKIAAKGDVHGIALASSACEDRSWIVRKAATDSLALTATLNDLSSLRKLAKMLEDFDPLPRMAAIYGMAELCGVGHRKAHGRKVSFNVFQSLSKSFRNCHCLSKSLSFIKSFIESNLAQSSSQRS